MLLKRKSEDVAGWDQAERTVWHSTVREQRGSTSLQIETDDGITILPYSYFQEARCRKQDRTWEIVLYWPWVIVSVKGRNLEKMPGLIAEHGLASLEFHPQGEKVNRDDRPELESVSLIPRSEEPVLPPPAGVPSPVGAKTAYRYSYSVG
jgi:hypothetical protein